MIRIDLTRQNINHPDHKKRHPGTGTRLMGSAPSRAVVSWKGPGDPIMLTVYGPAGEVALPLDPKRALTLAQEILTYGDQAIKADQ